jgi:DTW domain-containing protein YfiP
MSREMCYRCFWPKPLCWCGSIVPIATRTRIVILMHPKEYKQIKAATGRFTHLCLGNSEVYLGIAFDENTAVQAIINDQTNCPMLLYPGNNAINLSDGVFSRDILGNRQLVVFLIDATWRLARSMVNRSTTLQALPRLMLNPAQKSRYLIKKQPHDWCLSTIEAAHELMLALEKAGLDTYDQPDQMLDLFGRMQQYQIECHRDPTRQSYRPWEGRRFREELPHP